MVKTQKDDVLSILDEIEKNLSKIYTKREKTKEKIRNNRLEPKILEFIEKYSKKLKNRENKIKIKIFAVVQNENIRVKILDKLKKGLDKLSIFYINESNLEHFLNEMTDFSMFFADLNLEMLTSELEEIIGSRNTIKRPLIKTPTFSGPKPILPAYDSNLLSLLDGWPQIIVIKGRTSKFRPDFILNMTNTEKNRLKLFSQQSVINFFKAGAMYEGQEYDNNFHLKIKLTPFELKYDALQYLGNRIYFDPHYMKAVKNVFLSYGLKIFFNHNEYPLRINFLKTIDQHEVDPNIIKNLTDCKFTVSFGYENKSLFVLGTPQSEEKAKQQGVFS